MRKTRPNSTRHLRRRSFRTLLEFLEPRLLLDGSNVFARFTGELAYDHTQQSIPFSVSSNDFALSGNKTVLGFQVQRVGAGSLDPAAVAILNASGLPMPLRFSASDLTAYTQSLVIAELPYGSYTAIVASDRCSIGGFRLDVSLAGDVNGDRKVDQNELTLVRNMTGATSSSSAYRIEADSNLDGIITTFDYTQARDNLNDSTRLNPLTSVTLRASPAPITLSNGALVTNSNSPVILGTTLSNLSVALETGSDGKFDNGSTTSDSLGNYSFGAISFQSGGNTLQARVIDAFGQNVFATLNVTLDNVAPVIAIQSALPQFTRNANFTMSGQVTDNYAGVRRFELALDSGAFITPATDAQGNFATTTSLTGASEGAHTIHLRATDNVGNTSVRDISFTFDTRPPTITGTRTPVANANGWNNTDVVASFFASDSLSGIGSVTAPVTFSGEGAGQSIDGTALDLAGNSASSIVSGINIDKTKPTTSSSLSGMAGSNGWYRGPVTVSLGATDNLSQVRATYYVLDNGSTQQYIGPIVVNGDGVHTLNYWSVDKANNEETHRNQTIQIDTQSPAITVASPAAGSVASVNPTVVGQVTDTGSGIASLEARIDNGSYFAVSVNSSGYYSFGTSLPVDGSVDGLHTVHLRATDLAGNVSGLTDLPFILQTGITLREGTAFEVTKQQLINIPSQASALTFTFTGPAFDTSSKGYMKDGFEVALLDAAGNSLVPTFAAERDAFLNISEGQPAVLGSWARIDGRTVTLDLSHITPGTAATLVLRLVNNDRDINTSVNVSDVKVVPLTGVPVEQGGQPATAAFAPATVDFSHLEDISSSFEPVYSRTSFDDTTKVISATLAAHNKGQYPVNNPLIVAVDHISDPTVRVRGADGLTPSGLPYFDYSRLVAAGTLDAGAMTTNRTMSFYNPNRVQFTYDLVFLGQLNRDPQITTHPNLEGLVDKPYTYAVGVTDPDGDALTFSLQTAPAGMVIDSHSGVISWSPKSTDLGNQSVILQVEDGHGGSVQQQFALGVIQPPPNRPPVFTSTPIVDAAVGIPYSYNAIATDPDSDTLTYSLGEPLIVSVPIANPSFEAQSLGDGSYVSGTLSGWSISGSAGSWNPSDSNFPGGAVPDGQNAAWINAGTISQLSREKVKAGVQYRLSVAVGQRLDVNLLDFAVQLWAGGIQLATSSSPRPAPGEFQNITVTYDALANAPALGELLEIRLSSVGIQSHFDSVQLTATAETAGIPANESPVGMTIDSATGVISWSGSSHEAAQNADNLIDATYGLGAGSFEIGPPSDGDFTPLSPGNEEITGWTVGGPGDGVDWVHAPYYAADTGEHSIDLKHLTNSSISTVIPTVPGATYLLTFGAASVYGLDNTGVVSAGSLENQPFAAEFSGDFLSESFDAFTHQTFTQFSYRFTATELETTISFRATGNASPSSHYGPVIDNVSVVPVRTDFPVTVRVTDGRGGAVTQSFTIKVGPDPTNHSPIIISGPVPSILIQPVPGNRIRQTIDFEGIPAAPLFNDGSAVPAEARLFDRFASTHGVTFHSESIPTIAVVNLGVGHATSGSNGIGGMGSTTAISYASPIVAEFFVPGNLSIPALTDFVSINVDQFGNLGTIVLQGFGLDGVLLQSTSAVDDGVAVLTLSTPGIHRVVIRGTATTAFDDFNFDEVYPAQIYEYQVRSVDPDSDALTYTLTTAPLGMVIDAATGQITWAPTSNDLGPQPVAVRVDDGRGGFDTQSFTIDVSNLAKGEIRGTKFHDLNGDGSRDAGESGLSGWTIYLDQNNNDHLDADEQSTTTNINGEYVFRNLIPDRYIVREVPRNGWRQTSPGDSGFRLVNLTAGEVAVGRDFGNMLSLNPPLNRSPSINSEPSKQLALGNISDMTHLYWTQIAIPYRSTFPSSRREWRLTQHRV